MTLVHAGLLFGGIAAAAIPILIHFLFRRRRPPISWAAMDILLAALKRQERRLRLEQILLLAARCLLFGLAGLALARPTVEAMGLLGGGRRVVAVVLDDGAASQVRRDSGDAGSSAFASTRDDAAALVRALPPGDAVALVLASRPARAHVAPPSTDREAVARAIEALEPSASSTDLGAALAIAGQVIGGADGIERAIVVMSEFRAGSLDTNVAKPAPFGPDLDATKLLVREPAIDDVANVSVVVVEPQRSVDDDSVTVVVLLERNGGANAPQTVRVALDGDNIGAVASKPVRFEAGQATARVEFVVRSAPSAVGSAANSGSGRIAVRVDGDRVPLDDVRYASFDAHGATRIAIVARRSFGAGAELEQVPASRWLARALEPIAQPGLDVVEIEPASIDARTLRDIDALFVPRPETLGPDAWSALKSLTDRGGMVVVMPSADTEAQRWTERFSSVFGVPWTIGADAPALEAPLAFATDQPATGLFAAVDAELEDLLRPIEVSRRIEVRGSASSDVALTLNDGSPFLLLTTPQGNGRGLVALVTVAPELGWTNLPVKPFMVPFAQELVRRGLVRIGRADRVVVGDTPVAPRDAAELIGVAGSHVSVDATSGLASAPLGTPGVWAARDGSGRTVGGVAVNVDPSATRPTPQSRDAIAAWLSGAGSPTFLDQKQLLAQVSGGTGGLGIGFWVLIAVAFIAVIETMMARRFSHAAIVRGSGADPGVGTTGLISAGTRSAEAA